MENNTELIKLLEINLAKRDRFISKLETYILDMKLVDSSKDDHISCLRDLNNSLEELVEMQKKRLDDQTKLITRITKTLVAASNWIRKRKAADDDGWIPDDDLG